MTRYATKVLANTPMHSLSGTTPHLAFETAAYLIGAQIYWRTTQQIPPVLLDRLALIAGAVFGAFLGSKLLHVAEHFYALSNAGDWTLWIGGKSVLGGLLGGTLGVEIAKRSIGWTPSTGDAWVPALAAGLMIGRIGCQLSGPWDLTYGIPTNLPWQWDYGDGIGRHPTALYEIGGVATLWLAISHWKTRAPGAKFAGFMAGYCVLRWWLEFLKPPFGAPVEGTLPVELYDGLTAIQWVAVGGFGYFVFNLRRRLASATLVTI